MIHSWAVCVVLSLDWRVPNTVLEKPNTLLGFNYMHTFALSMTQSAASGTQTSAIEQPCGQYKIHKQGHSLTVTVPRRIHLDVGSVFVREGKHHGRTLYLKVVPVSASPSVGPQTIPTDAGVTITDEPIDFYDVRTRGEDTTLTIPSDCDTDRFPEETYPMIVAGYREEGVAHLKLIPECVYKRADSVTSDDLVRSEMSIVT